MCFFQRKEHAKPKPIHRPQVAAILSLVLVKVSLLSLQPLVLLQLRNVTPENNIRKQYPSTKIPACPDSRPNDIFNYGNLPRDLSDSEVLEVICNHWKPGSDYSFPVDDNSGRRFQHTLFVVGLLCCGKRWFLYQLCSFWGRKHA